ncbi:MAG: hypothetical protein ABII85_00295 [Bacillota bacterium]
MTISQLILVISMAIVFTQWQTPLLYMHMDGVITKRNFTIRKWIGNGLSFSLVIMITVALASTEYFPNWTYGLTLALGANIISIITYSIISYRMANLKSNFNHEKLNFLSTMPYMIMIALFIASILEFVLKGKYGFPDASISTFVNFNLTSNLALRMLIRIFLFSFVIVTMYVLMVFSMAHAKNPNQLGLSEIKNNLKKNKIYIVITIAVFLSFFHLAEIDTMNVATETEIIEICESNISCDALLNKQIEFNAKFDKTVAVFHLIATAFFIPLFFDELHSRRDLVNLRSKPHEMKLKKGMVHKKWKKK